LIKPDIFAKGGDYELEMLPEAAQVEELGGEVIILPYVENHSTSGIIERISKIASREARNNKEIDSKGDLKKSKPKNAIAKNEPLKLE
jgi:hypothetical protein